MIQTLTHYGLHFLAPGILAYVFFKERWKAAWLIMIVTMLVDLDHIYACKDMFPVSGGFQWHGFSHLSECKEIFVPG